MRAEHWPEILAAKIAQWSRVPFAWGTADCMCFILDVASALTDRQIEGFGDYDSEFAANRIIASQGGSLSALVTSRFGAPLANINFAHRGDVLIYRGALGVCVGQYGVFRSPDGTTQVPVAQCDAAWRVD